MNQEEEMTTCQRCGRQRLPNCDGRGTQHVGFCAYTKCENLSAHDLDLLELKRKKHKKLLLWFDTEGTAVTSKGQLFRTCSVGLNENPWVIVWGPNMKLKAMKKATFQTLPEIPEL